MASLVGVAAYNTWLKRVPIRRMLLWTTLTGTGLGLSQLLLITGANRAMGISDQWFALGDSLVMTVLGQLAFMPILVLATRLCPEGVEATLFATLMSVFNGGAVAAGFFGGVLMRGLGVTGENFDNLALLVVICSVSSLAPLPFLFMIDAAKDPDGKKEGARAKD